MRESFFGLNVAVRGLFTAQRNLDVVSHNINNVTTPGFSRQQAVQKASRPMPVYDGTGMIGTGADVVAVKRVRDEYLDFKYWSESVSLGEWQAKKELLSDMEVTFNEPSDSGFTKILGEFYSALQELGKDPSSLAVRALVRERGVTVAKYFNSTAAHFEKMQEDVNYRVKTKVEEINSLATQIQQLNRQIYISELDGSNANDLRDRRTLLVDRMSKIINLEANELVTGKLPDGRDDKHFVITISGKNIVDHFNVSKLAVVQRDDAAKLNAEDIPDLYEVQWEDGNKLKVKGGELRGYLDIRDGNEGQPGINGEADSPNYKGIPYYIKKLDQFVQTFAMAFNEGFIDRNADGVIDLDEKSLGHADGYGLDPDGDGPLTAQTGIRFFTMLGPDKKPLDTSGFIKGATTTEDIKNAYRQITAKTFALSADITNSLNNIAASDTIGEAGNIKNLNSILKMRHDKDMFAEGSPEDFMKSVLATLGVDSQQAVRYEANQKTIVHQIENRRLSDSGVAIDEEMANMVKFQHAYNAAARMIVTMSEIYDTLINRTGL